MTIITSERVGEIAYSSRGTKMEIIAYRKFNDIDVKFENGYIAKGVEYVQFKRRNLTNPFEPSVYKFGYHGEGKYRVSENGKHTKHYIAWKSMLNRCYGAKLQERSPTYMDCTVHKHWHNFQNFGEWYDINYYEIEDEIMALDKDILVKNNKAYSPRTCVFVPHSINTLIVKRDKFRGNLPIGVNLSKCKKKYESWCSNGNGKRVYLGACATPEESFQTYKEYKENKIKEVAEKYKYNIPEKLYLALINYEVDIND
ncbi:hypothetical protein [Heyndrickxia oleronia]|jgi:hypothetical protein|uniref:hypothetical protein n=1 Tax=Heyndrickxia oleronia TaxID=38875 RepID=UPI00242D07E3|nr:hypothetical protein [Heyndrickxia oleronia]MCI1763655.1 hypothetical protein [Heyndrickxia oleronia]